MAEEPAGQGPNHTPFGCFQAILGLLIGGITSQVLFSIDPFGVVTFTEPQGANIAERAAAFAQWESSIGVIIGQVAMALIPLLLSGLCGVFVHKSLPASIPVSLLRMVGVASLLLVVWWVGAWAIDRALSTGESSDIRTALAMLAFEALCYSLAAPLSAAVTRRRSPGVWRRVRDLLPGQFRG